MHTPAQRISLPLKEEQELYRKGLHGACRFGGGCWEDVVCKSSLWKAQYGVHMEYGSCHHISGSLTQTWEHRGRRGWTEPGQTPASMCRVALGKSLNLPGCRESMGTPPLQGRCEHIGLSLMHRGTLRVKKLVGIKTEQIHRAQWKEGRKGREREKERKKNL